MLKKTPSLSCDLANLPPFGIPRQVHSATFFFYFFIPAGAVAPTVENINELPFYVKRFMENIVKISKVSSLFQSKSLFVLIDCHIYMD